MVRFSFSSSSFLCISYAVLSFRVCLKTKGFPEIHAWRKSTKIRSSPKSYFKQLLTLQSNWHTKVQEQFQAYSETHKCPSTWLDLLNIPQKNKKIFWPGNLYVLSPFSSLQKCRQATWNSFRFFISDLHQRAQTNKDLK